MANKRPRTLAIVYLNRGKTEEERISRERFKCAFKRFHPKLRHQLYIINKGFEHEQIKGEHDFFRDLKPRFIDISDDGFDLDAYREAAIRAEEEIIFFMNTHSEPLQEYWLEKIYNIFCSSPLIGLVGCSGNVETHHPFLPDFPKYPNYHIRTNAFMTSRDDYLLWIGSKNFETKQQAFHFEAGNSSLTRLVESNGQQAFVAGKRGVVTPNTLWRSGIFRSGFQKNLLVGDNQTRTYQECPLLWKLARWMLNYSYLSQIYPPQRIIYYLLPILDNFPPLKKTLRSIFQRSRKKRT